MSNHLLIRPISWSVSKTTPSIELFGYTPDGRTIYVRIPKKSTYVLKFDRDVTSDMVVNITDILSPYSIKPSYINSNLVIVRSPKISPNDIDPILVPWTVSYKDTFGDLESLFQAIDITPYEWISISRYSPIPGKYSSAHLNINAEENDIANIGDDTDLPYVVGRLFFWDIETYSSNKGEFSNASNPGDFITMISIVTGNKEGNNAYVIYQGDVNENLINKEGSPILVKAANEKDILTKFFAIYNSFKPDRQVYYNGDMFDMPYLLTRLSLHNLELPQISKIPTVKPYTMLKEYPTPFGREKRKTMVLPGTEIIDLLPYYRLYYPHLKNHKLDTVSKFFLGHGKTGLSIDQMMKAVKENDPNQMAKVVEYSFVDSLRMTQLWDDGDIQDHLEIMCNNLGITIETLLTVEAAEIINKVAYNIDAGIVSLRGKGSFATHGQETLNGIYKQVYIYDYSELYREIMKTSKEELVKVLADRLEGAPPKLIVTAFYSSYVNRTELLPILTEAIEHIVNTKMIISIEPFKIISRVRLSEDWVREINIIPGYIGVSKGSYILIDKEGEIEFYGMNKICRPRFVQAANIIKQYIKSVYTGNEKEFVIPEMKNIQIEMVTLTHKLVDVNKFDPTSINSILSGQFDTNGINIAKYVMTNNGPILVEKVQKEDVIDYKYYEEEVDKYIKEIQKLKVYK